MKHIIIILCFLIIGSDVVAQEAFDPIEGAIIIQCERERDTMRPQLRYLMRQALKHCGSDTDCKLGAYRRAGVSTVCAEREIEKK